jgi:hypothetical protein
MFSMNSSSAIAGASQVVAQNISPTSALFPEDCVYSVFARVYRVRRRSVLGMVKMITVEVDGRASHRLQPRSPVVGGYILLHGLELTSS